MLKSIGSNEPTISLTTEESSKQLSPTLTPDVLDSPQPRTPSSSITSNSSSGPISVNILEEDKPSFHYDLELFNLCKTYIDTKNHHGLALIARQKGLPPFLRFKIWPILLKYHPFVLNPFLQPDNEIIDDKTTDSSDSDNSISKGKQSLPHGPNGNDIDDEVKAKIKKDLSKYIQRLKYSNFEASDTEKKVFETLKNSIYKFVKKWDKIIKYDQALTWMALNLAEWFPPISNTPWVLTGRDNSANNSYVTNIFDDYSNYIDSIPDLRSQLEELVNDSSKNTMSFHDVYERLVLVLLHSPEERVKHSSSKSKINKSILPINGGIIEERVSFFIYCLRKSLPELSQFFQEEQILNKFGNYDDEWLIWWLKYCGSKVWSKYDRGRIWDLVLGWRLKNPKKDMLYYVEKLNIEKHALDKLGPDIFWSVGEESSSPNDNLSDQTILEKKNSFKDLINELNNNDTINSSKSASKELEDFEDKKLIIPFSKLDPHIELIFVSLALLKSKQNTLVELDQHEIRQFLSRLPTKSYTYKQIQKQKHQETKANEFVGEEMTANSQNKGQSEAFDQESEEIQNLSPNQDQDITLNSNSNTHEFDPPNVIISNDSTNNHKVDFMDNIIIEAGELWRKWLWSEMVDDN